MSRLIHVGNAIVDVALTVSGLPERGGDVIASATSLTAGGAVNTLVAAARDGLPAVHAGVRGTGPFADVVAAALETAGVEAIGPVARDVDTGFSIVLVEPSAERTFVTSVGAEARLSQPDLAQVEVEAGDVIVVTGYALQHSGVAIASWLSTVPVEATVVVDPSPIVATLDPGTLAAVLARADVLTANAREARLMVGGGAGAGAAGDAVALAALLRPCAAALVRDGVDGCWVAVAPGVPDATDVPRAAERAAHHVPGFAVTAVDTTGAGDAHCGVLCAALSRAEPLVDAVRRANAAAALAVTRRGPATSPASAEIDALLAA
ncbi:PfkB family carbohydrate kinase [Frondihabitans australicus]|uniref:Sugar/nucleoside kinase (Ribokinase family) n=1 Tax=Frondihabitans australicus TaxID=386892 RepID=A0A495ID68_9MICO|nr:PfkB family carbohydrate kinase [Frondihabitans australicus]RKR72946.1 sugar/nucleoside kinase (ribokinase family) [Frondihabitans australicus]